MGWKRMRNFKWVKFGRMPCRAQTYDRRFVTTQYFQKPVSYWGIYVGCDCTNAHRHYWFLWKVFSVEERRRLKVSLVTSSGSYRGKGNCTASCEVCRHLSPGPLFQIASRGAKPETPGLSLVRQILQRYRLNTTSKQFMAMIPENFDEGGILRVLYGKKIPAH
jgi:hypothetical protein